MRRAGNFEPENLSPCSCNVSPILDISISDSEPSVELDISASSVPSDASSGRILDISPSESSHEGSPVHLIWDVGVVRPIINEMKLLVRKRLDEEISSIPHFEDMADYLQFQRGVTRTEYDVSTRKDRREYHSIEVSCRRIEPSGGSLLGCVEVFLPEHNASTIRVVNLEITSGSPFEIPGDAVTDENSVLIPDIRFPPDLPHGWFTLVFRSIVIETRNVVLDYILETYDALESLGSLPEGKDDPRGDPPRGSSGLSSGSAASSSAVVVSADLSPDLESRDLSSLSSSLTSLESFLETDTPDTALGANSRAEYLRMVALHPERLFFDPRDSSEGLDLPPLGFNPDPDILKSVPFMRNLSAIPDGRISLLQGGPGTGKTRSACALLRLIQSRGKRGIFMSKTNTAAGQISKRLLVSGECFVRFVAKRFRGSIADPAEYTNVLREVSRLHPTSIFAVVLELDERLPIFVPRERRRIQSILRVLHRQIRQLFIRLCKIIVGTVAAAYRVLIKGRLGHSDVGVVDESSLLTEGESLLALWVALAAIFLGDPNQMHAHDYLGEIPELAISFMKRVLHRLGVTIPNLQFQFRCHPMISCAWREAFYEGRILDGPTAPAEFAYNVSGCHLSWQDALAEDIVGKTIEFVTHLQASGVDPCDILVLSYYKYGLDAVRQATGVTTQWLKLVDILTAAGSQGAERAFVALMLLTKDRDGILDDFMVDTKPLCVLLSRASGHFAVIGDLKRTINWRDLQGDPCLWGLHARLVRTLECVNVFPTVHPVQGVVNTQFVKERVPEIVVRVADAVAQLEREKPLLANFSRGTDTSFYASVASCESSGDFYACISRFGAPNPDTVLRGPWEPDFEEISDVSSVGSFDPTSEDEPSSGSDASDVLVKRGPPKGKGKKGKKGKGKGKWKGKGKGKGKGSARPIWESEEFRSGISDLKGALEDGTDDDLDATIEEYLIRISRPQATSVFKKIERLVKDRYENHLDVSLSEAGSQSVSNPSVELDISPSNASSSPETPPPDGDLGGQEGPGVDSLGLHSDDEDDGYDGDNDYDEFFDQGRRLQKAREDLCQKERLEAERLADVLPRRDTPVPSEPIVLSAEDAPESLVGVSSRPLWVPECISLTDDFVLELPLHLRRTPLYDIHLEGPLLGPGPGLAYDDLRKIFVPCVPVPRCPGNLVQQSTLPDPPEGLPVAPLWSYNGDSIRKLLKNRPGHFQRLFFHEPGLVGFPETRLSPGGREAEAVALSMDLTSGRYEFRFEHGPVKGQSGFGGATNNDKGWSIVSVDLPDTLRGRAMLFEHGPSRTRLLGMYNAFRQTGRDLSQHDEETTLFVQGLRAGADDAETPFGIFGDFNSVIDLRDWFSGDSSAIGCTLSDRKWLMDLTAGLTDVWRFLFPESYGHYTGFEMGLPFILGEGYRIDGFFVCDRLLPHVRHTSIDTHVHRDKGDHHPVALYLDIESMIPSLQFCNGLPVVCSVMANRCSAEALTKDDIEFFAKFRWIPADLPAKSVVDGDFNATLVGTFRGPTGDHQYWVGSHPDRRTNVDLPEGFPVWDNIYNFAGNRLPGSIGTPLQPPGFYRTFQIGGRRGNLSLYETLEEYLVTFIRELRKLGLRLSLGHCFHGKDRASVGVCLPVWANDVCTKFLGDPNQDTEDTWRDYKHVYSVLQARRSVLRKNMRALEENVVRYFFERIASEVHLPVPHLEEPTSPASSYSTDPPSPSCSENDIGESNRADEWEASKRYLNGVSTWLGSELRNVRVVDGDILQVPTDYLTHQTNCVRANRARGLAEAIFTNIDDSSPSPHEDRPFRSIRPTKGPSYTVVNLNAQRYPGAAYWSNDTREIRLAAFRHCLKLLGDLVVEGRTAEAKQGKSIVTMPIRIGCGLGKGNLEEYHSEIERFANEHVSLLDVILVRWDPGPPQHPISRIDSPSKKTLRGNIKSKFSKKGPPKLVLPSVPEDSASGVIVPGDPGTSAVPFREPPGLSLDPVDDLHQPVVGVSSEQTGEEILVDDPPTLVEDSEEGPRGKTSEINGDGSPKWMSAGNLTDLFGSAAVFEGDPVDVHEQFFEIEDCPALLSQGIFIRTRSSDPTSGFPTSGDLTGLRLFSSDGTGASGVAEIENYLGISTASFRPAFRIMFTRQSASIHGYSFDVDSNIRISVGSDDFTRKGEPRLYSFLPPGFCSTNLPESSRGRTEAAVTDLFQDLSTGVISRRGVPGESPSSNLGGDSGKYHPIIAPGRPGAMGSTSDSHSGDPGSSPGGGVFQDLNKDLQEDSYVNAVLPVIGGNTSLDLVLELPPQTLPDCNFGTLPADFQLLPGGPQSSLDPCESKAEDFSTASDALPPDAPCQYVAGLTDLQCVLGFLRYPPGTGLSARSSGPIEDAPITIGLIADLYAPKEVNASAWTNPELLRYLPESLRGMSQQLEDFARNFYKEGVQVPSADPPLEPPSPADTFRTNLTAGFGSSVVKKLARVHHLWIDDPRLLLRADRKTLLGNPFGGSDVPNRILVDAYSSFWNDIREGQGAYTPEYAESIAKKYGAENLLLRLPMTDLHGVDNLVDVVTCISIHRPVRLLCHCTSDCIDVDRCQPCHCEPLRDEIVRRRTSPTWRFEHWRFIRDGAFAKEFETPINFRAAGSSALPTRAEGPALSKKKGSRKGKSVDRTKKYLRVPKTHRIVPLRVRGHQQVTIAEVCAAVAGKFPGTPNPTLLTDVPQGPKESSCNPAILGNGKGPLENPTVKPSIIPPYAYDVPPPEPPSESEKQIQNLWGPYKEAVHKHGSHLEKFIVDWLDGRLAKYWDSEQAQSVHMDDGCHSVVNVGDGYSKLVQMAFICIQLGVRISMRKLEFLRDQIECLGFNFNYQGTQTLSRGSLKRLDGLPDKPSNPDVLRKALGLSVYFSTSWHLLYKEVAFVLRFLSCVSPTRYRELASKEPYSGALLNFVKGIREIPLHAIPYHLLQSGLALLFILIDACMYGAGYLVAYLLKKDLDAFTVTHLSSPRPRPLDAEAISKDLLRYLRVVSISSNPWPSGTKWMGSWQFELLGGLNYKRNGDAYFKYTPRKLVHDLQNLGSSNRSFTPAAVDALTNRALEYEAFLANSPGLEPLQLPGSFLDRTADPLGRMYTPECDSSFTVDGFLKWNLRTVLKACHGIGTAVNPDYSVESKDECHISQQEFVLGESVSGDPIAYDFGEEPPTLGGDPEVSSLETRSHRPPPSRNFADNIVLPYVCSCDPTFWTGLIHDGDATWESPGEDPVSTRKNLLQNVSPQDLCIEHRARAEVADGFSFNTLAHDLGADVHTFESDRTYVDTPTFERLRRGLVFMFQACPPLGDLEREKGTIFKLNSENSEISIVDQGDFDRQPGPERAILREGDREFLHLQIRGQFFECAFEASDQHSFVQVRWEQVASAKLYTDLAVTMPPVSSCYIVVRVFGTACIPEKVQSFFDSSSPCRHPIFEGVPPALASLFDDMGPANHDPTVMPAVFAVTSAEKSLQARLRAERLSTKTLMPHSWGTLSVDPDLYDDQVLAMSCPDEGGSVDEIIPLDLLPSVDVSDSEMEPKTRRSRKTSLRPPVVVPPVTGFEANIGRHNPGDLLDEAGTPVSDLSEKDLLGIFSELIVKGETRGKTLKVSVKSGMRLTAKHCQDLAEKTQLKEDELWKLIDQSRFTCDREDFNRGFRASRLEFPNLGKTFRVRSSLRCPDPANLQVDRTSVPGDTGPIIPRPKLPSAKHRFKWPKFKVEKKVAVRIIAAETGGFVADLATNISVLAQVFRHWRLFVRPETVSFSDKDALATMARHLPQLGISCPVLARKYSNGQPSVCNRQLLFGVDWRAAAPTWDLQAKVNYCERLGNDRVVAGINISTLLPRSSQFLLSECVRSGIMTHHTIASTCTEMIQRELKRSLVLRTTLDEPEDPIGLWVVCYSERYLYFYAICVGGIDSVVLVAAGGDIIRIHSFNIAWFKNPLGIASHFDTFVEACDVRYVTTALSSRGHWVIYRLKIDAGDVCTLSEAHTSLLLGAANNVIEDMPLSNFQANVVGNHLGSCTVTDLGGTLVVRYNNSKLIGKITIHAIRSCLHLRIDTGPQLAGMPLGDIDDAAPSSEPGSYIAQPTAILWRKVLPKRAGDPLVKSPDKPEGGLGDRAVSSLTDPPSSSPKVPAPKSTPKDPNAKTVTLPDCYLWIKTDKDPFTDAVLPTNEGSTNFLLKNTPTVAEACSEDPLFRPEGRRIIRTDLSLLDLFTLAAECFAVACTYSSQELDATAEHITVGSRYPSPASLGDPCRTLWIHFSKKKNIYLSHEDLLEWAPLKDRNRAFAAASLCGSCPLSWDFEREISFAGVPSPREALSFLRDRGSAGCGFGIPPSSLPPWKTTTDTTTFLGTLPEVSEASLFRGGEPGMSATIPVYLEAFVTPLGRSETFSGTSLPVSKAEIGTSGGVVYETFIDPGESPLAALQLYQSHVSDGSSEILPGGFPATYRLVEVEIEENFPCPYTHPCFGDLNPHVGPRFVSQGCICLRIAPAGTVSGIRKMSDEDRRSLTNVRLGMIDSMCLGGTREDGQFEDEYHHLTHGPDKNLWTELLHNNHGILNDELFSMCLQDLSYVAIEHKSSQCVAGINGVQTDHFPKSVDIVIEMITLCGLVVTFEPYRHYRLPGWASGRGAAVGIGNIMIAREGISLGSPESAQILVQKARLNGKTYSFRASRCCFPHLRARGSSPPICCEMTPLEKEIVDRNLYTLLRPRHRTFNATVHLPFPAGTPIAISVNPLDRDKWRLRTCSSSAPGAILTPVPVNHNLSFLVESKCRTPKPPPPPPRRILVEVHHAMSSGLLPSTAEAEILDKICDDEDSPTDPSEDSSDTSVSESKDDPPSRRRRKKNRPKGAPCEPVIGGGSAVSGTPVSGSPGRSIGRLSDPEVSPSEAVWEDTLAKHGISRVYEVDGFDQHILGKDLPDKFAKKKKTGKGNGKTSGGAAPRNYASTDLTEDKWSSEVLPEDLSYYSASAAIGDEELFGRVTLKLWDTSKGVWERTYSASHTVEDELETLDTTARLNIAIANLTLRAWHDEGLALPIANVDPFGIELIDFSRPLPRASEFRPPKYPNPYEKRLIELLIARDVWSGASDLFDITRAGPARMIHPARTAPRKGKAGRVAINFIKLNKILVSLQAWTASNGNVFQYLRKEGVAVNAFDISRAFPSLRITPELSVWSVISAGEFLIQPKTAYLGVKCWPAVWQQLSYPLLNSVVSSGTAGSDFWKGAVHAASLDREAGIPTWIPEDNVIQKAFAELRKMDLEATISTEDV